MSFLIFSEVTRFSFSFVECLAYILLLGPIIWLGISSDQKRHKQFLRGERKGVRKSRGILDYLFFWTHID